MKFSKVLQAVALCGGLLGFGAANASVMTFAGVNDTGSILYSTLQDGATLSATMQFTLSSISATSATFALKVSNNSSGPGDNTLASFGIDVVSPALKTASTSAGWHASMDGKLTGGAEKVDLCIWAGSNCNGASNKGLGEGLFDTFSLTLTTAGNFLTNGISFT
ncbi:cistern family PEP-CTERM protein, partial [Stenotrophomonas sp. YIM B06876]|uniref:cistern family PEP-CTERM protein n=1 Tax=Stenotrophomonas sp. YIM B06876 TaxID=3060211 RepID=UPI002739CD6C